MAEFNLQTVNTAIKTTLAAAASLKRSQDLGDITDTIPNADAPLLQVIPQTWSGASNSGTHQNAFGGKGTATVSAKQKTWVFDVFIYISRYAKFNESMELLVEVAAEITEILDTQQVTPLFGSEAVRSFQYTAERGVIPYSNEDWNGIKITISCECW